MATQRRRRSTVLNSPPRAKDQARKTRLASAGEQTTHYPKFTQLRKVDANVNFG